MKRYNAKTKTKVKWEWLDWAALHWLWRTTTGKIFGFMDHQQINVGNERLRMKAYDTHEKIWYQLNFTKNPNDLPLLTTSPDNAKYSSKDYDEYEYLKYKNNLHLLKLD